MDSWDQDQSTPASAKPGRRFAEALFFMQSLNNNVWLGANALVEAIEKKDSVTAGHAKRVELLSLKIGTYLRLGALQMQSLALGAVLHDLGKIGVGDQILKKCSPLSDSEWPEMRTHPDKGVQIAQRLEVCDDVLAAMRFHHERWDGRGYPVGLSGLAIPLSARIVAVADAFDAITHKRPYKGKVEAGVARLEISKNSGAQFCPQVVQAFLAAV